MKKRDAPFAMDMDMVRRFAGADPDADPSVLETCCRAALSWYDAAGVTPKNTSAIDQYAFWVANLAAWFYDNRGASDANIPPYIVASVHQLRPVKGGRP